jgi:hypothetical protein
MLFREKIFNLKQMYCEFIMHSSTGSSLFVLPPRRAFVIQSLRTILICTGVIASGCAAH